MRVSRNYTVDDWKVLKFQRQYDWERAVDIFRDRLETRYLEHIRALLERKTNGFVVLALDSALIETLEQFRRGTKKTPWKQGKKYFVSFLTETAFGEFFDQGKAELFYTEIRCGLLHQTEADGNSRIKRGKTLPLVSTTTDGKGIIVNTYELHSKLEDVIKHYTDGLVAGNDQNLREAFRKKMSFICRMEEKDLPADMSA